jgi:hypothetical protein
MIKKKNWDHSNVLMNNPDDDSSEFKRFAQRAGKHREVPAPRRMDAVVRGTNAAKARMPRAVFVSSISLNESQLLGLVQSRSIKEEWLY